jgi:hypothetical protein
MTGGRAADSVEAVFREERGRLLAMLVRQFGDLDLAEDAASDAVEAALAADRQVVATVADVAWAFGAVSVSDDCPVYVAAGLVIYPLRALVPVVERAESRRSWMVPGRAPHAAYADDGCGWVRSFTRCGSGWCFGRPLAVTGGRGNSGGV